ncbi:hypothetical protein ABMA27_001368 [Loxostege sticticalis]|uniref:FLYWCH-type domain-containing protein n=1 Tax=Loxostege sticticalis TaxID=481309 RepID=A0ABR3HY75_LOXSC
MKFNLLSYISLSRIYSDAISKRKAASLPSIQIVMSKRGKPLLCVDGYTYFKKTTLKGKTRWCCSTHVPRGCKASIHTTDTEIIRTNTVHNHKPSNSVA